MAREIGVTALTLIAATLAAPAAAQDDRWSFEFSPYAWAPGTTASVETQFGHLEADASIGDVLSALDFAAMGVLEARNGPGA